MQLQAALDYTHLSDAMALLEQVAPYVDVIEVGTPLVISEGLDAVREIRAAYPGSCILCDLKLLGDAKTIATDAFEAGSDVVTVSAHSDDATFERVLAIAEEHGGRVCANTLFFGLDQLVPQTRRLVGLGVQMVTYSFRTMDEARSTLDLLAAQPTRGKRFETSVSAGITPADMPAVRAAAPDVVVVGRALMDAASPADVARSFKKAMAEG